MRHVAALGAGAVVFFGGLRVDAAPPGNDWSELPVDLTAGVWVAGTTSEATQEPWESLESQWLTATVWYAWTAPVSGAVEVRVRSTEGELRLHPLVQVFGAFPEEVPAPVESEWLLAARPLGGTDRARRFQAVAGARYLVQVANSETVQTAFQVLLRPLTERAEGDDFAEAAWISPDPAGGVATLSFYDATREAGEPAVPQGGPTVWRRWTVPATGWYMATSVSLEISDIEVFRGASLDALVPLKENRRGGGFPVSTRTRTLFHASAGETLYLQFASCNEGEFSFHLGPPVEGDVFSAPYDLGSVENFEITQRTSPLTCELDEPSIVTGSLWFTWVCPKDGMYRAETTTGSKGDTFGYIIGHIIGYDPAAVVYQGDTFDTLVQVPSVSLGGSAYTPDGIVWEPRVFRATAGTRYRFLAGITPYYSSIVPNSTGTGTAAFETGLSFLTFHLTSLGPPPPNDNFADAEPLVFSAAHEAIAHGRTSGATWEEGEPHHPGAAGDSVWHRVTIPVTGMYEISLQSEIMLQYQLFRGDSLSTLTRYSVVTRGTAVDMFEAGDAYYIRIAGLRLTPQGSYVLGFRNFVPDPPTTYDPLTPVDLGRQEPVMAQGASAAVSATQSAVLWRWTAPRNGWYRISRADGGDPGLSMSLHNTAHSPPLPLRRSMDSWFFRAEAEESCFLRATTTAPVRSPLAMMLSWVADDLPFLDAPEPVVLGSVAVASTPRQALLVWDHSGDNSLAATATWTAPASGWYAFDTEGSDVPVELSIRAQTAPLEFYPSSADPRWRLRRQEWFDQEFRATGGPMISRLLGYARAGETYALAGKPLAPGTDAAGWTLDGIAPPAHVQINLRPAAAPPVVTGIRFNEVPPAAPGLPPLLEALIAIDSPNGMLEGFLQTGSSLYPNRSTSYYFDGADRVEGDTFSGRYRVLMPPPNMQVEYYKMWLRVAVMDARAGQSEADGRSLEPLLSGLPDSFATLAHDVRPPVLEGIQGLPPVITLDGRDVPLVLRLGISDAGGSGFERGEIYLEPPAGETSALTGAALEREGWKVAFDHTGRVRGSAQAGVYDVPLTIPAASTGSLRLRLWHRAGHTPAAPQASLDPVERLWQTDPPSLALPTILERNMPADITPPAITPVAATFDADAGSWGRITATARLADSGSGIGEGSITLVDANDSSVLEVPFSATHRISGTAADGVYEAGFDVPPRGLGGAHWVVWKARDTSGLVHREVFPVAAPLPDRRNADQRKPRLTLFQFSPSVVDLTRGPATLTAVLAATDDRPGLAARCQIFSERGELLASQDFACLATSLECIQSITLPQVAAVGPTTRARVVVGLVDAAGRTEVYGLAMSPAWPNPDAVVLDLAPAPSSAMRQWQADFPGLDTPPSDATRDTDRDGWPDAVEFLLNLDPLVPMETDVLAARRPDLQAVLQIPTYSIPQPAWQVTATWRLALAPWVLPSATEPGGWFTDSYEADGWRLFVEESADLHEWRPVPLPVERASDRLEIVSSRLLPAPPGFFRLRVVPP